MTSTLGTIQAWEAEVTPTPGTRRQGSAHMDNRVRELRHQRELTQAALAEAMGVSRNTINSIETGRYTPSLTLAIALARYFERSVEEVFG